MSTGWPNSCTGMIARSRCGPRQARIAASSAVGVAQYVRGSTSTSTGVAPASSTTLAVAGKVKSGTSTASPGPMSSASKRQMQCGRSRGHQHRMPDAQPLLQLGLEGLALRAVHQHAAAQHVGRRGDRGLVEVGQREADHPR
ncbi:MAG: hypothetical protein QM722_21370 [Piscinibacter sp.]